MDYRRGEKSIYLRIDKHEEAVKTLIKLCRLEKIEGASLQGIGACDKVVIATYIPEQATYQDDVYTGMIEMVNLTGNISTESDGAPAFHGHGVFSFVNDGHVVVVAGHVKEAHISYTGEIVLDVFDHKIERMFSEPAGIDVWKLSSSTIDS